LGKGQPTSDSQRRYVRIVHGMFSGLAGRGVAALVSFISVPLTVRYLGAERYGAWVTISTAMAWIAIADLGLSSSVLNAVSQGYAKDNRKLAGDYIAAGFWSLVVVTVVLSAVFYPIWRVVSWDRVFNVHSDLARAEVGPAVAVAFAIFVLNLPFSIVFRAYSAYQEVAIGNAWLSAGNVLSLVGLILVTRLNGGLVFLVIAVSGSVLLMNVVSAVWLFGFAKPWLLPSPARITWSSIRELMSLGSMFFVVQIAALLLFQTDNLIIAHYLGAAAVTPYSVTWRLFTYTMIFQTLASGSYWPAYTEAFTRGDRAWVRRGFRTNFQVTVASTAVLALPLVLWGQPVIRAWAGAAAVPPSSLLLWMGAWSVIYAATCSQSAILAASSRLRGQMIYSMAAAIVNIGLTIVLVNRIGLTGAILGTIIAYLTCLLVPQWIEVGRALRD
jgi:O-antigen/teichoic acid export membrane protein